MHKEQSLFKNRRVALLQKIAQQFPDKRGPVILFGAFEKSGYPFRQESSFYYLTGIQEPGVVLVLQEDGKEILFAPAYEQERSKWVATAFSGNSKDDAQKLGIEAIVSLGTPCKGYEFSCLFSQNEYSQLIAYMKATLENKKNIFTLYPTKGAIEQRLVLERLERFIPELATNILDISPFVASLRRIKSQAEIEAIYNAVDCTMTAQEAAAQIIEENKYEYEVSAGVEFIFAQSNGRPAFPSIVATGVHATTLHHTRRDGLLKRGDVVIVDIGAELDYYCADITRTYPVSGTWTKRQKQLYTIVLETQEYIASLAKPGMYLVNKAYPEKSLHHLAVAFLTKAGYGSYFNHSIGHYLGLDVHDVGSYEEPLQAGDVITIEPGIYIPEEKLGIRIEDNYWITQDDAICLSQDLPKDPSVIEEMMVQDYGDEEYDD